MGIEREARLVRTKRLIGEAGMERLANARVAVFGLGGVGGHLAEALARSGVGTLDLVDHDLVSVSNLNRQLFATQDTIGMKKTDAAAARIAAVAPDCSVQTHPVMFLPETAAQFDFDAYDYVADAIDTVTGKLSLIEAARAAGTPIISSMGAGNRLDAGDFHVTDLFQTSGCPLAKIMRKECRRRGIDRLKVVCADTPPREAQWADPEEQAEEGRRAIPGSVAFVPSVAGLLMAGEIVREITGFTFQCE